MECRCVFFPSSTGVVLAVIANVTLWYAIREAPGSTVNAMEDVKTYLETTKRVCVGVCCDRS